MLAVAGIDDRLSLITRHSFPLTSAALHCRKPCHLKFVRTSATTEQSDHPDSLVDVNRLQTQLSKAVAAEDFAEAAQIRDQLKEVCGDESTSRTGWTGLGVPDWLADRAERLGFLMPTEIQHRAIKLFLLGADVLLRAHTGSGKTMAFLMPVLSMLEYPPLVYVIRSLRTHHHTPMLPFTPHLLHSLSVLYVHFQVFLTVLSYCALASQFHCSHGRCSQAIRSLNQASLRIHHSLWLFLDPHMATSAP